jgi:hypothetical protein
MKPYVTKPIRSDKTIYPCTKIWYVLLISIFYCIIHFFVILFTQLFRCLESYGRKPPRKSIVRKVADAYEVLGLPEEKEKLLNEYNYLFDKSSDVNKKKYGHSKKTKKEGNLVT